jgi:hypothetical protein
VTLEFVFDKCINENHENKKAHIYFGIYSILVTENKIIQIPCSAYCEFLSPGHITKPRRLTLSPVTRKWVQAWLSGPNIFQLEILMLGSKFLFCHQILVKTVKLFNCIKKCCFPWMSGPISDWFVEAVSSQNYESRISIWAHWKKSLITTRSNPDYLCSLGRCVMGTF